MAIRLQDYDVYPNEPEVNSGPGIQTAIDQWMKVGGVLECQEGVTYRISDTIQARLAPEFDECGERFNQQPKFFHLQGNGATFHFPESMDAPKDPPDNPKPSFLIDYRRRDTVDGKKIFVQGNQDGHFIISDLRLKGPVDRKWYTFDGEPQSLQEGRDGLSIQYCQGVKLRDVFCSRFRSLLHVKNIWPFSARDCSFENGKYGVWLDRWMTLGVWDNISVSHVWFGVTAYPTSHENSEIMCQKFNNCRFESIARFGILFPMGQSIYKGHQMPGIKFFEINSPYVENVKMPLLVAQYPNLSDPFGAGPDDSIRPVAHLRIVGGRWPASWEDDAMLEPYEGPEAKIIRPEIRIPDTRQWW